MSSIEHRPLSAASTAAGAGWRTPVLILGFGCLISLMSFGPRSSLGFFLTPLSNANHWGRDVFGFALALQNLLWGIGQPLAGMIADRYGSARVLCAGGLMYAAGLALMSQAASAPVLDVSAGLLIGFGLSGTSFMVVLAAFGKLLPPEWRSRAFGFGTAAGSFGQFLYSPLAVALMDGFGWQQTLLIFGASTLAILPLSLALTTPKTDAKGAAAQSLRSALGEAFAHRSYLLLVIGFFTCGFQLAFITVHMPSYLVDRGLSAQVGGWTLAAIGLFNIIGSIASGWLGDRMPKRYLLSFIYFVRAAAILVFISFPVTAFYGTADQRHYCRYVRHALVGDTRGICLFQPSSRRLPRRLARRRRIRAHRLLRPGVVARDPVRHPLRTDQHADRRKTGRADSPRAGLSSL